MSTDRSSLRLDREPPCGARFARALRHRGGIREARRNASREYFPQTFSFRAFSCDDAEKREAISLRQNRSGRRDRSLERFRFALRTSLPLCRINALHKRATVGSSNDTMIA